MKMTSDKTPARDTRNLEVTQLSNRRLKKLVRILHRRLSDSEKISCQALDKIFWDFTKNEEHEVNLEEVFASPLYSDNCKRYFAASHIDSEFILRFGDSFLDEELIMSQARKSSNMEQAPTDAYFRALTGSAHLSERILLTVLTSKGRNWTRRFLDLIPDTMITPQVISSWLASGSDASLLSAFSQGAFIAAKKVRQAHPEYAGFPDEWVLKVFCEG